MDPQIQTSFIPKETTVPSAPKESGGINILPIISFIVLFLALATYGGAYLYKGQLNNSIDELKVSLARKNSEFDKTSLSRYEEIDRRIRVAKKLVAQHLSVVPLFNLIEARTLQGVRFKNFQFSITQGSGGLGKEIHVKMSGEAKNYIAVAQQSDLFGNADDAMKENVFTNIVFSNLNLDSFGNVIFDVSFVVSPRLLSYENPLEPFK